MLKRHNHSRVISITRAVVTFALLALLALFFSSGASAGSAPGILKCKSLGRPAVTLEGQVPGDYEVFDLTVKRAGSAYALKSVYNLDQEVDSEERAKLEEEGVIAKDRVITLVEDFRRGIFTMALRRMDVYDLRLYAVPGTVRSNITPNSKKASFDAMLLEGDIYPNWNKAVKMRCTFDHSI